MAINKPIQTLNRKQQAEFERIVKKALRQVWPELERELAKLPRDGVNIAASAKSVMEVSRVTDRVEKLIESSGLNEGLTDTLQGYGKVSDYVRDGIERQLAAADIAYGSITMPDIKRVVNLSTELLNIRTAQGVSAIRSALTQAVVFGQPIEVAAASVKKALASIGHDALTDMVTAQRQYLQDAEDEGAAQAQDILGLDDSDLVYRYEGAPLQDNSHPECVWALSEKPDAPYFTAAERDEFESGGGYPHGEPRWNCQHEFVLDIEKSLSRAQKKAP